MGPLAKGLESLLFHKGRVIRMAETDLGDHLVPCFCFKMRNQGPERWRSLAEIKLGSESISGFSIFLLVPDTSPELFHLQT